MGERDSLGQAEEIAAVAEVAIPLQIEVTVGLEGALVVPGRRARPYSFNPRMSQWYTASPSAGKWRSCPSRARFFDEEVLVVLPVLKRIAWP